METWIFSAASFLLALAVNIAYVAYKTGQHSKELESLRISISKEIDSIKIMCGNELQSLKEVTNLKIEFLKGHYQDCIGTLAEIKTTNARLGNELSKLLGQLEADSNGKNNDSERR